jgi:hypothetical protein
MDRATVEAIRTADASIAAQAIESELRLWWRSQAQPEQVLLSADDTVRFVQHILRRGRHG